VNPGSDLSGGVTVADLDGDGDAEIVGALADFGGPYVLFAYDHTGQPLPGFPLTVGDAAKRPSFPVVGDLDDDGDLEIAATAVGGNPSAGLVAVYHHDGQLLAGWPKSVMGTDSSPPVLGDLDGDGSLEVLTGANELTPRGALFVWKGDGSLVPGWPVFTPQQSSIPFFPPLLFDSDADGRLEVVAARFPETGTSEDGRLTSLGFGLEGFTHEGVRIRELARPVYGGAPFDDDMTPSVGDLDGDGLLEMVWLEDNTIALGQVVAHLWDLDTPADAVVAWNGYRGDARHSGVAQPVVPIVQLTETDRDVPMSVDGLARFRVTTGGAGVIQIAHPWQADVVWGFDSGPLS